MVGSPPRSRLPSTAILALIVAMYFPLPDSGEYAEFGVRLAEIGPMPGNFSFQAYDAETGDFLFGTLKAKCDDLPAPSSNEWTNGRITVIGGPGATFRLWDVGPSLSQEEWAVVKAAVDRSWNYHCDDSSPTGPTQNLSYVRADAGHFPQFPDRPPVSGFDLNVHIPMSQMGPDHLQEHRVRVEGDPFEVRVWSGVGLRDESCNALDREVKWRLWSAWADDRSHMPTDRHYLMCVSYRYLGGGIHPEGPWVPLEA